MTLNDLVMLTYLRFQGLLEVESMAVGISRIRQATFSKIVPIRPMTGSD